MGSLGTFAYSSIHVKYTSVLMASFVLIWGLEVIGTLLKHEEHCSSREIRVLRYILERGNSNTSTTTTKTNRTRHPISKCDQHLISSHFVFNSHKNLQVRNTKQTQPAGPPNSGTSIWFGLCVRRGRMWFLKWTSASWSGSMFCLESGPPPINNTLISWQTRSRAVDAFLS